MEKIFWVKNGDLDPVNTFLERKKGRVKMIHPVVENIATYGYAGGESLKHSEGHYVSETFAYVVVEYEE